MLMKGKKVKKMATFHKTLRKHIFLHPADLKRKYHAVKSTLLRDKQKYSDKLEGALLDVDNLKIVGDRHLIVEGYHSMEVDADFHVFSPQPGQVLEGVINKCSKSHIGCLVMNTFNAALTQPSTSDLEPTVGSRCTFVVTEVVVDGELLFIRGTLESVSPNDDLTSTADAEVKSEVMSSQDSPEKKADSAPRLAGRQDSMEAAPVTITSPSWSKVVVKQELKSDTEPSESETHTKIKRKYHSMSPERGTKSKGK